MTTLVMRHDHIIYAINMHNFCFENILGENFGTENFLAFCLLDVLENQFLCQKTVLTLLI